MRHPDGKDLMFASAGILWGCVQVYRGCQLWREGQERLRISRDCAVGTLPMGRAEFPLTVVTGLMMVASCAGYIVWSLFIS